MMKIYRAINASTDIPFAVRVVEHGENYGKNGCLTHSGSDPLIEFFDARFAHERDADGAVLGQFVSRYSLDVLTGENPWVKLGAFDGKTGITLDGGIHAWVVDAEFVAGVRSFLVEEGYLKSTEAPGIEP